MRKRKIRKIRKKPIEKKIVPDEKKPITYPFGGHLPNPPKDCQRSEYIFIGPDNTKWIDLSICHKCIHLKECTRRKEYLKERKKG